MRRIFLATIFLFGAVCSASSQSSPNWGYGYVPTPAEWSAEWASKQDYNGSSGTPCYVSGCTMTGPLITAPSTTSQPGFFILPGTAPTSPANGAMWMTSGGLYAQINGTNVLVGSPTGGFAFVGLTNTFTAYQIISLNSAALQAAQTGALLQVGNANGTASRIETDCYAAACHFTAVRADGTAASPTTLQSGDSIASFNAWGYNGSAFVGPQAALRCYAAQNWTTGALGTYCDIATTPDGGTTLTQVVQFNNDGGITVPSTVTGGDNGAGTINAAGIYVNGTAVLTSAVTTFSAGTTGFTPSSATAGAITLAGMLVVASGGTNCSSASITCFNNITGFTAAGTTGTTSTNLVFSTSPTLVTPALGAATGTSLALGGATLGGNALAVTGTVNISSTIASGADTITSASANALAVGLNGATNPAFNVDSSTGSQVAGLNVKGAAHNGTVAIAVTDSSGAANLTINALSTGTIGIGSVSTGAVTITPATTVTGALTASATVSVDGCTIGSLSFCSGTSTPLTISTAGLETIANATDTTSGTTGSLNTLGGVGITKALFVGTSGTFGTQQTTQGSLVLANTAAGSYATTLQSSNSASASATYTLPTAPPGGNGYSLTATTAGVMSWVNVGGGGGTPCTTTASSIQYDAAGSFGCVSGATSNGTTMTFASSDLIMAGSSTGVTTFASANSSASNYTITFPAAIGTVSLTSGANPTATAGPSAINGSATSFMRSDGAPAVQVGSSSQEGIVQVDNTTITASAGTITAAIGTGAYTSCTPTDQSGASLTFTNVSCEYAQIGKVVVLHLYLTYPSTANGSNAAISIPVATPNQNYANVQCNYWPGSGASFQVFYIPKNGSVANLYNSTGTQHVNSDLSTQTIRATCTYPSS